MKEVIFLLFRVYIYLNVVLYLDELSRYPDNYMCIKLGYIVRLHSGNHSYNNPV